MRERRGNRDSAASIMLIMFARVLWTLSSTGRCLTLGAEWRHQSRVCTSWRSCNALGSFSFI